MINDSLVPYFSTYDNEILRPQPVLRVIVFGAPHTQLQFSCPFRLNFIKREMQILNGLSNFGKVICWDRKDVRRQSLESYLEIRVLPEGTMGYKD
jgi:hypothetical protein